MPVKVEKKQLFSNYIVKEVVELNYFDLTGEKAKTKGTSNKSYHIELQVENSGRAQNFSLWGATGGNQTSDWRYYNSEADAKKDFDKIIKSKKKKGYVEVDVALRTYGSEAAKQIVKTVKFTNIEKIETKTSLHPKVQELVTTLFGSTNNFVISTLKCPLGQLTNKQVDYGRDILKEAKDIIKINDSEKIKQLTNNFYAAIPHNLGHGSRGTMSHLMLDTEIKIAQKEADLDTLMDAKSVGAVLTSSNIESQYESLNANIDYLDRNENEFKWIEAMVHGTRAHNHHFLGKINLLNVWKLNRKNEEELFLRNAEKISNKCKDKHELPKISAKYIIERPKIIDEKLYKKANILPLYHGTRTENVIGITKNGFLIRPSGVILCGSLFGNAVYFSPGFSKSVGYSSVKSSYWANGKDDAGFMFLSDVILGNQKIISHGGNYTLSNIYPCHSVYAKAGGAVINDEHMIYQQSGPEQQHKINYLLQFSCGGK